MSEDAPLLSVLCLTFNHEQFVAQALQAIAAQEVAFQIEVVVADDCSTDGTIAVIEQFRPQWGARLRVLPSLVNLGVTRNFRRALDACRGRYIALCEGDDYWRGHDKLQRQVDFLQAHPEFVLTYHDAVIFGPVAAAGRIQLPRRLRRDASQAQLIATRPISTLTVCFRNVLGHLPPELDHAPVLDLCLWSLLGHHGKGKYLSGIEPAAYRVHVGGVFSTQSERNRRLMTAQSLLCLARVYARMDKRALGDRLLLKAILMASVQLSLSACLILVGAGLVLPLRRWVAQAWQTLSSPKGGGNGTP